MTNTDIEPTNSRQAIWWSECWWEDVEYQREYGVTLERIQQLVEPLKGLFNERWTQAAFAAKARNPILAVLYGGKGLWPFENLMWLGKLFAATTTLAGFNRQFQRLIGDKSSSTLFELEVASWFVEKGWQVEFLKASAGRRTPDLGIHKDDISTAIECKKFESEQWEEWSEGLSLELLPLLSRSTRPGSPSFDVYFEPRLSDLVWDDERTRAEIRSEIVRRICAAVQEATNSEPPREIVIPGIAKIRMRQDLPGSGLHGMGGIQISPQAKMRRIVRNGVLVAAEQLKSFGPGAVVIKTDFVPSSELVDVALTALNLADRALLDAVAIVVIVDAPGNPPVIWKNPMVADSTASESLGRAFVELFPSKHR